MNTRKKQEFKIHTGSVSEIALFTVNFKEKAEKKFSEKTQKTRNQSDHPRQKKRLKNGQILILHFFGSFWEFSQPRFIGVIFSLLHLFKQLETQV